VNVSLTGSHVDTLMTDTDFAVLLAPAAASTLVGHARCPMNRRNLAVQKAALKRRPPPWQVAGNDWIYR